ncbi:MAG: hypothetical protein O9308_03950 [Beijerinckiaceae bacterium]|jgi:hypothetical protein|nr:hypothetical protein [Beijerinckiaceae bacterium]
MRYDLEMITQLCREIGLLAWRVDDQRVDVDLCQGAVLSFINDELEDDCRIGFLDTPWHVHGDLMFLDRLGYRLECDYLNLLTSMKEGRVLICEREVDGQVVDRWLAHSEYNDEFGDFEEGERIIVRRAGYSNQAG